MELDFAKIDAVVAAVNNEVNLCAAIITLTPPDARLRSNPLYAQRSFNGRYMPQAGQIWLKMFAASSAKSAFFGAFWLKISSAGLYHQSAESLLHSRFAMKGPS